jgi:hypothetical protein
MLKRTLYPFILGLYFVLFVFSENLGETYLEQTVGSIAAVLLVTAVLLLLLFAAFRNLHKAAFVTALIATLIFVHAGIADFVTGSLKLPALVVLLIEIVLLGAIAFATLRSVTDWPKLTGTLNVMAGALLLLTVYRIGSYGLADGALLEPDLNQRDVSFEGYTLPDNPPNIFFILTDAYTRADTLADYFSYDNSEFIEFLRASGFEVADASNGNYPYTYLAANTALNFEFVTEDPAFADATPKELDRVLNSKIYNNRAGAILQGLGYEVVTIQSGGQYVRTSGAIDITRGSSWLRLNEFDMAVLDTTLLPRLFRQLTVDLWSDRSNIEFVIDEVTRQASSEGPLFVIAHIMSPHPPFIYDRDGNIPDIEKLDFGKLPHLGEDARGYRDQVHYLNSMLKPMISSILENSRTPPIIVLQGDHGLRVSMFANQLQKKIAIEDACFEEVLANLNAMYLPGATARQAFYPEISPVNTFRLILDQYFGGNLGLLDDRAFFPERDQGSQTRRFKDITTIKNTCNADWQRRFDEIRLTE